MSKRAVLSGSAALLLACSAAAAQTVNGSSLTLQSSGAASGNAWTLSSDGYVGTYITLSQPAAVTLTASAGGTASDGVAPDLTFAIGNDQQSFTVAPGASNNYTYTTPTLGAGTYLVRTQLDDQTAAATPALTVNSLTVGGTGVSVSNVNTNANALAAATTYANNYRSGNATLTLLDSVGKPLPAGAATHVQLTKNAFNFTLAVPGQSPFYQPPSNWLNYNTTTGAYIAPTPGSTQALYQQYLKQNFNSIVPENAGKWQNEEFTQGSVNMSVTDAITDFASANGLGERMHNLIWANQQPGFINTDFTNGDYSAISSAITSRIGYYVSQNNVPLGTPRADSYAEMDVFNEPLHNVGQTDDYQTAFGNSGIASIYSQVANAVKAAGASTRLYVNEYNVLQFSSNPATSANDPYANWYLNYINGLNNAGYGHVVTGVGTELYVDYPTNAPQLSPSTMIEAQTNLAGTGDPQSLTEFGLSTYGMTPSAANFAADLTTALTMDYGNPDATTFGFWGGLGGPVDANATTSLYNSTWGLTVVGQAYQAFQNKINTNLNLTTGAGGLVNFNGTYGTYAITIDGQTYNLNFNSGGQSNFTLTLKAVNGVWASTTGGSWTPTTNWTGGTPQFAGDTATFGSAITAPATVTLDGAQSVASLAFNSANSYTLTPGNGGSLTLDNAANNALVTDTLGAHTIAAPVVLNSNTIVNAASSNGGLTFSGNISGSGNLILTGPGNITLSGSNSYAGSTVITGNTTVALAAALPATTTLSIGATSAQGTLLSTGKLTLAPGIGAVEVAALNFTGGGSTDSVGSVLDITNNSLTINYGIGNPSPLPTIEAEIISGSLPGGDGIHAQIISSSIASNSGYAVGYADGSVDTSTSVAPGTIRIQYALIGDANLDGTVNLTDLLSLLNNYGSSSADWADGDFNYDNNVNLTDLLALLNNYGQSTGLSNTSFASQNTQAVPEPAAISLLALGSAGLFLRRRDLVP